MIRIRAAALAAFILFSAIPAFRATAAPTSGLEIGARPGGLPVSLRAERLLDRERLRAWGIERPSRLAFDEGGALYVLDARARRVVRLALGSRPLDGNGESPEGATPFEDEPSVSTLPHDLALDRRGSLLVLDRSGGTLLAYDRRASYLGTREIDGSLREEARAPASRLVRDTYGNLWLLASRERDLIPLDERLLRKRTERFLLPEDGLVSPVAAAFLARGGGWVADRGTGLLKRFDATGRIDRSASLADSLAGSPCDLTTDDAGAVYVADDAASRIVVFDADGTRIHTRWLGGGEHPWRPSAIAWGGGDRLAVADESRGEIWIFAVERARATP